MLNKFGVPGNIFIKAPCIKFHENPSSGCYVRTERLTYRHEESTRRLSWISANAAKYPDSTMILFPHSKESNINYLGLHVKSPILLEA